MPGKDIVVIGASAGGIETIRSIVAALPATYSGAIFVVIHTAPDAPRILDTIFNSAGKLPASVPEDGDKIEPGRIYVARPDRHLIIEPGRVRITRGPKENRFRPAVDPLFRSAAQTYGPRVVGVVLSGGLDDGTSGLATIKQLGGTAVVQDPHEAWTPSMPQSALNHVRVDHVVSVRDIAPLLVRLAAMPADAREGDRIVPEDVKIEVDIAGEERPIAAGVTKLGEASNFACPECHGVLLQMKEATPLRFRCHTGHAYSVESLLSEMQESIEDSLWNAVRAIEERVMLMRQAAQHLNDEHESNSGQRLLDAASVDEERAELVREAVLRGEKKAARRA